jgi:hypothetical protein
MGAHQIEGNGRIVLVSFGADWDMATAGRERTIDTPKESGPDPAFPLE